MGLPARKLDARDTRTPVLRLLRGGGRPARRACRTSAAETARCRAIFHTTLVIMCVVMALGMLRVQVTVQATEAAMVAGVLKQDIENERIRSEMLEADRTALAAPSRIESIAGVSMGMGAAEEVDYLELVGNEAHPAEGGTPDLPDPGAPPAPGPLAGLLAEVMRMTAGEAQVLLVGDAGIASSR